MLKFNRNNNSDKLSEQFGIEESSFEEAASLWGETQEDMNKVIKKGMEVQEDGVMLDARGAMEAFLRKFNTQELQSIALVQLIMKDISDRGQSLAMEVAKEQMKALFSNKKDKSKENLDDFEELL